MRSRRRFLKFGVAGALILATATLLRGQSAYRPASSNEPLVALDENDRWILAAIVPAMLPGVPREKLHAVVGSVDRAIAGLPPHLQREVQQLLALLGSWAGRRWIAGVRSPWPTASQGEVASFLSEWRFSRWRLLQQGYHALHELVFAAWYARPDSWAAIGYPGPPELQ